MKVLNMIFMSVTAFSLAACSVSSDSDEVLTENLNQYTGIYEGYAAEYLGDSIIFSDSSFMDRIWMDDTGLFWSPILGEIDSVADEIKYSNRMRFNDEMETHYTLEDAKFIFTIHSTLLDGNLIKEMDVRSKNPTEYPSRRLTFSLQKN
jgi:hypothetical protein